MLEKTTLLSSIHKSNKDPLGSRFEVGSENYVLIIFKPSGSNSGVLKVKIINQNI